MKKFLLLFLSLWFLGAMQAQTITIIEPAGMVDPYEVSPGTQVTFQFDYYDEPPTKIFTYHQDPVFPDFGTDPEWTESTAYTNNGDGTYNFTLTISEETWIFTGYFQSFISMWAFSNVVHIQTVSEVIITYDDGMVCGDGIDYETLTVQGDYDSYQWYRNNEIISGATQNTYQATQEGAYKVQVSQGGESIFSNTLHISETEIAMTPAFTVGNNEITLNATSGFDNYQWFSGTSSSDLSPISGATQPSYTLSLPSQTTYIAVEGTTGSCTVSSVANPVSAAAFATPVITLSADTNSFGKVCEGTTVSLSANGDYASYLWYQNEYETYNETSEYTLSQGWEQGSYKVEVTPTGWPEVKIMSQPVDVTFFTVSAPDLITSGSGTYCPGSVVNIILGDEGYDYTWYVHNDYNYSESDAIENPGAALSLNFENQTYVTVVANYQGCTSVSTVTLYSAANDSPYISFVNWNDEYLCDNGTAEIEVSSWSASNYSDFQWCRQSGGSFVAISGATSPSYTASQTGKYRLTANVAACTDLNVESNIVEVKSYTDREMYIYANSEQLCMGEETELFISGGDSWQNIQWFKEIIQMGNQGYEKVLQPLAEGAGQTSISVTEFGGYAAKARHESCPIGIKITSNVINIKPAVNPQITVDPDYGIHNWHLSTVFDSVPSYIFCTDEPVGVSVNDNYDSYTWYLQGYGGGDFNLGDPIPGANGSATTVFAGGADWVTVKVEQDGCAGISTPVLIDTWVFSPPAIASYGNAELCEEGDSTLLHNAFPGNYAMFEWYLNGQLIPNSNNDSIWATQPGLYTLTVYREECPQFGMSTGTGPTVSFLTAYILENDTVIYAMPELGFYSYQWYFNGEPLDYTPSPPWVLYKDQMEDGIYTVEVSNPDSCISLSDPYVWTSVGLDEINRNEIMLLPNPVSQYATITGVTAQEIVNIKVFNTTGKLVFTLEQPISLQIDMDYLSAGVYILELNLKNKHSVSQKFVKVK